MTKGNVTDQTRMDLVDFDHAMAMGWSWDMLATAEVRRMVFVIPAIAGYPSHVQVSPLFYGYSFEDLTILPARKIK